MQGLSKFKYPKYVSLVLFALGSEFILLNKEQMSLSLTFGLLTNCFTSFITHKVLEYQHSFCHLDLAFSNIFEA
jgi:hypothetical protein